MRLSYLPLIVVIIKGCWSSPVAKESLHDSVWSDSEFVDTVNDYFTSAENLRRSKSLKNEDLMSSEGSQLYPQVLPLQPQQQVQASGIHEQWSDFSAMGERQIPGNLDIVRAQLQPILYHQQPQAQQQYQQPKPQPQQQYQQPQQEQQQSKPQPQPQQQEQQQSQIYQHWNAFMKPFRQIPAAGREVRAEAPTSPRMTQQQQQELQQHQLQQQQLQQQQLQYQQNRSPPQQQKPAQLYQQWNDFQKAGNQVPQTQVKETRLRVAPSNVQQQYRPHLQQYPQQQQRQQSAQQSSLVKEEWKDAQGAGSQTPQRQEKPVGHEGPRSSGSLSKIEQQYRQQQQQYQQPSEDVEEAGSQIPRTEEKGLGEFGEDVNEPSTTTEQQSQEDQPGPNQLPSQLKEQWKGHPNAGSPTKVQGGKSDPSQITSPPLQIQDSLIFRLPEQLPTPAKPSRKNRHKNRQSKQQRPVPAAPVHDYQVQEVLRQEGEVPQFQFPMGHVQPLLREPQLHQPQFHQPQLHQPQLLIAQPQEQLAQPQTIQQSQVLIAQMPNPPSFFDPSVGTVRPLRTFPQSSDQTLENEVEKAQPNLIGQIGSWVETGRKLMYLPRGVVDVLDQAMSYAEQSPYVGLVMDKVADKLFGSTKAIVPAPLLNG